MENDPSFTVTVADDYVSNRRPVPLDVVTPPLSSNADHKVVEYKAMDRGKRFTRYYQRNKRQQKNPQNLTGSQTIIPRTSKFTLPKGWSVKRVLRRVGGPSDKYYREPGTGRQFRSLKEVERYVTGGVTSPTTKVKRLNDRHDEKVERDITEGVTARPTRVKRLKYHHDEKVERDIAEGVTARSTRVKRLKYHHDEKVERDITEGVTARSTRVKRLKYHHDEKNSGSQELVVAGGKMLDMEEDKDNQYQLATVSPTSVSTQPHPQLPDGWVVEEVPRRAGGYIDKYYFEPGTGQKFRSMLAVRKYLSELEDNSPLSVVLEEIKEKNLPLSKAFKLSSTIKNRGSYSSWKNSISKKEKTSSSFGSPPSKINWVISGNGGDAWNAFEDETLVADSVKQHWGNTFMMAINNKHSVVVSG